MKLFVVVAFVAGALADVSDLGYNYQQHAAAPVAFIPQNYYIPPALPVPVEQPYNSYIPAPAAVPVEQLHNSYIPPPEPLERPHNTYIPPVAAGPVIVEQPQNAYIPPAVEFGLAEDGYRYKTVRRLVHKNRA